MHIGQFADVEAPEYGVQSTLPLYFMYEMSHAALNPARALAETTRLYFKNPLNPWTHTQTGRQIAASAELFERTTRRYGKPSFGITSSFVNGMRLPITERIVWERPFCRLIHFEKTWLDRARRQPKVLVVAPMSGHFSTLLRGTVEDMLPGHDVYVTDWIDARMVPAAEGAFDLDDYIDYVISMLHRLGPDTHVMAVCQPAVPVFAAVAMMEAADDPYAPLSMTLMGGPIDTRQNPTAVNKLAEERGIDWFRRNVITSVPFPHPGFMRPVYPGFLQLTGFVSMNFDRHMSAHRNYFQHLVDGDGDSAEKHRDFYDEYLAVMDLAAEFYLQTVDTVFIRQALPKGEMTHRGRPVDPARIRRTALMTVEGERDDISGLGQTKGAHALTPNLPEDKKVHWMQPRVGHYGVFNGSRFRSDILPRISDFMQSHEPGVAERRAARAAAAASEAAPAPSRSPAKGEAREGAASDDLTRIGGIGPKIEKLLNEEGIFHYWQIARLSDGDIARIEQRMSVKGRIARDKWVEQARGLATVS